MLRLEGVKTGYGPVTVLHGLDLTVERGEVLCLLGRNGAGKSTTLKAIMGLLPLSGGTVSLDGETVSGLPSHEVPKRGIGYVPQGRRLFTELSVAENIEIGLMTRSSGPQVREKMLTMFPRLRERLKQRAGTLSGGEQQMLAMARAMCLEPSLLLLDEPTEGLQPSMIALIRETVVAARDEGVGVVLVEQRVEAALDLADRVAFLENGYGREVMTPEALRADPGPLQRYLGV